MNEYAVERLLDALQSLTLEVQLFREAFVAHNSPRLERIDEPFDYDCETCKHRDEEWDSKACDGCCENNDHYEPQTDCAWK